MGLLDGLLGNVIGSTLGGNRAQSPFGAARNQGQGGNLLLQIALSMLQQNGGLEALVSFVVKYPTPYFAG